MSEDRLEALGALSLRPDNINTYVYAQFMRSVPSRCRYPALDRLGQPPTPIKEAVVQLMDQDVPRPAGDDAQPPAYSRTTTSRSRRSRRHHHNHHYHHRQIRFPDR